MPVWGRDLGTEPGPAPRRWPTPWARRRTTSSATTWCSPTPSPPPRPARTARWIAAPRLDNLGCCHSGVLALLAAAAGERTQVLVCNDHEEVGSGSMSGARGSFLEDVVARLAAATDPADPRRCHRAIARSRLVSADMAHAVHPTRSDRHEPDHQPQLGGGPVLKVNANQAYATDAASGGWFTERCAEAGVPVQHFVSRARPALRRARSAR